MMQCYADTDQATFEMVKGGVYQSPYLSGSWYVSSPSQFSAWYCSRKRAPAGNLALLISVSSAGLSAVCGNILLYEVKSVLLLHILRNSELTLAFTLLQWTGWQALLSPAHSARLTAVRDCGRRGLCCANRARWRCLQHSHILPPVQRAELTCCPRKLSSRCCTALPGAQGWGVCGVLASFMRLGRLQQQTTACCLPSGGLRLVFFSINSVAAVQWHVQVCCAETAHRESGFLGC